MGWFVGHMCQKILTNGVPDRLNYCVIFIVYTQFTDVATCHRIQPGRLWVGDLWSVLCQVAIRQWDMHFDSLCGKRSGQFISVLQLKQVACVPELIYVGVML